MLTHIRTKKSSEHRESLAKVTAGKTSTDMSFTEGIIGASPKMQALFRAIPKIASSDAYVLIQGESGTGKELVAQAIHEQSRRSAKPFYAVNCAALPEGLIQSELFGHEKGAFTGAHQRKTGRFEAAAGGTILLDEIGDMPLDTQINLLRFLETQKIERVGGCRSLETDVRVIAASHIDLEPAIQEGIFRGDLFYRLNVLSLRLPPLRDRGDDIHRLADHFFNLYTNEISRRRLIGFGADARLAMNQWRWPGNVRELKNRVHKATVMCEKGPISRQDLGLERRRGMRKTMTLDDARDNAERDAILTALDFTAYNVTEAAEKLQVCRMTLYRLMKKHGIEHPTEELDQEIR
jgi:DNA-binding NtrC family response regulator